MKRYKYAVCSYWHGSGKKYCLSIPRLFIKRNTALAHAAAIKGVCYKLVKHFK